MRIVRIILIIGMSYCLIGLNQILQTLPGILGTTRQCCYRCCPILSRCCGRTIDNLVHIRHGQFQTFQVRMQPSSWSIRDTRPILRQGTSVQVRYLSSNSTKTRTQNSPCNPRKKRCTRSGPKTFWLFASCVVVLVKIATNHQHFGDIVIIVFFVLAIVLVRFVSPRRLFGRSLLSCPPSWCDGLDLLDLFWNDGPSHARLGQDQSTTKTGVHSAV